MSVATITEAERAALHALAVRLEHATQHFVQNGAAPSAAFVTAIQALLDTTTAALINAGAATTLPATQAVVSNNGSVPVKNSAGSVTKTGTATVAANAITGVALPAASAIVDNAGVLNLVNSAGTSMGQVTAAVAAGVVTNVATPSTRAILTNGTKVNAVAVTGTGNFVTPTISNGVITALALSAS